MSGPLRVLLVAAECAPFAQFGGLGDVIASLPRALRKSGHDARILLPWYPSIQGKLRVRSWKQFHFQFEGAAETFRVGEAVHPNGVPLYLLGSRTYISRMYGDDPAEKTPMMGEHRRFWFFCEAAFHLLRHGSWRPQLVHCHDNHTGLLPELIARRGQPDDLRTMMTVHNAEFQASFYGIVNVPRSLRDDERRPLPLLASKRGRFVNFLRRGLEYADAWNTVSPTHVRELMARDDEFHIRGLLLRCPTEPLGILNGIDVLRHDPKNDPDLIHRYSASTLARRTANKALLQKYMGLPVLSRAPLLTMVSRMAAQKGLVLVLQSLDYLLRQGCQLALLGNGRPEIEQLLTELAKKHPRQIAYRKFDLPHESLFYAGGDLLLMPSKFEPCGLSQLKALRYGCVPLVRAVGGLKDVVTDVDQDKRRTNGFAFHAYSSKALCRALARALKLYERPLQWRRLQLRGMREDWSWDRSAQAYVRAYRACLKRNQRRPALRALSGQDIDRKELNSFERRR